MSDKMKKPKQIKLRFNLSWLYIILLLAIGYMIFSNNSEGNPKKVEWTDMQEMFLNGDIEEITYVRNAGRGDIFIRKDRIASCTEKYSKDMVLPEYGFGKQFWFDAPNDFHPKEEFESLNAKLAEASENAASPVYVKIDEESDIWGNVANWVFPIILIIFWIWMFRGMNRGGGAGGQGGIFSVGKATGKLQDKDKSKVTFKDVAGLYGAKEEVVEIVDFLKNPKKYTSLGAKIPKGALLVGPPGTGKTLLAKAVAGEADVPFFSISGSDFVEMFVGVGASRVRDLFRQAKEKAPCIVFIDEIDAVGRARGKNAGFSSNDERENTLNQLLTEMDGFGTNSGVIVLAATNRADILDKALMRAGRFDRQIHVDLPELKEREEIFNVHIKNLKLADDFDVNFMAKHTSGFCGADIANVCNEAALTAARRGKTAVGQQDFLDAVDRIIGGLERKGFIMTKAEKRSIAYHEAGHASVSWLLPYADPLFKVTLIPRGEALGAAWYLPDDRKLWSKSQMIDRMCSLIGGRVAEEIINGEPSTGAQNDLERLTRMAYAMVQYYGMSDKVGLVSYYDSTGSRGYDLTKPYSEKTAEIMDAEAKALVQEIHDKTYKLLIENREGWEKMAQLLIEKEVIFAKDVEEIFGPKALPAEDDRTDVNKLNESAEPEQQPEQQSEQQPAEEPAEEPKTEETDGTEQ